MLKLWGRTNSSNVMKVLWLLDELGLAYERIDAGLAYGRTQTPEYLAMSPFALVPALQDGHVSVFESNAILRYLCRTHARGTTLYPADPVACAPVDAWMDVQQTKFGAMSLVFQALVRTPPAQRDSAAIAAATAESARNWAVLDARLVGQPYVCGDTLTLADVALGPNLHRWFALPIERPDLPALRGWYERLLERTGYATHVAQPLT